MNINITNIDNDYIVTINESYKEETKEKVIQQLILDLEKLKADLIDEQYKEKKLVLKK